MNHLQYLDNVLNEKYLTSYDNDDRVYPIYKNITSTEISDILKESTYGYENIIASVLENVTASIDETVIKKNVDEGVDTKRIKFKGSKIDFEESKDMIWILDINTIKEQRNKGQAKKLIAYLRTKRKKIDWGAFSELGEIYLKKYVKHNDLVA